MKTLITAALAAATIGSAASADALITETWKQGRTVLGEISDIYPGDVSCNIPQWGSQVVNDYANLGFSSRVAYERYSHDSTTISIIILGSNEVVTLTCDLL